MPITFFRKLTKLNDTFTVYSHNAAVFYVKFQPKTFTKKSVFLNSNLIVCLYSQWHDQNHYYWGPEDPKFTG